MRRLFLAFLFLSGCSEPQPSGREPLPTDEPPRSDDAGAAPDGRLAPSDGGAGDGVDAATAAEDAGPSPARDNPYGAGLDGHPMPTPNPVTGRTLIVDAVPGDGRDDRPAIQAAIDAAAFGDEVYLPDGVYDLLSVTDDEGTLMLRSGVNLRGESEAGVVLRVGEGGAGDGILTAYAKNSTVEDVLVSRLTIAHAGDGTFKYGVRIAKNTSYGSGVVRRIVVDEVTVRNAHRRAFRVYCASDVVIRRSTASDLASPTTGYGFEAMCERSDDPEAEAKWIVFQDDRALGPNMRHGFIIQDHVHHSLIEGCLTVENYYGAIELHAAGEHHIEIRENVVRDSLGAGIKVRSGAGGRHWIHDNRIEGAHWGILVEVPEVVVEHNTLVDFDIVDTNLYGIHVGAVEQVRVHANVIEDNHVDHEDYFFEGIHLAGTRQSAITDNRVERNHRGMFVDGEELELRGNVVRDNVELDVEDRR